jgi:hypothetical protein
LSSSLSNKLKVKTINRKTRNFMKQIYTSLLLILGAIPLFAQGQEPIHQHSHDCGHDHMMEKLYQIHPELEAMQRAVDDDARIQGYGPAHLSRSAPVVYTIPVVVHVVHRTGIAVGSNENISDAQIQDGITHMNEAFRNIGFYDPATGEDIEIEFCLAAQDELGNFSTGITRTASNTYADLDMDTEDAGLKVAAAQWDPLNYCNIWLVRQICSSVSGSCGVAGYAYLAGAHGAAVDGIVNEASFFGSSRNNSKVHIHEMGHYLNLRHTFQSGCGNNDCTTDGDQVCDTPPDNATTAISCGSTTNTCNSDEDDTSLNNPFRPVALGGLGEQNDMFQNYMDYGFQNCQERFTDGQRTRMRSALTGVRASLLSSPGCINPSTPAIFFNQASANVSETFDSPSGSCNGYKDITISMSIGAAPTGDANVTINYAGTASGANVDYTAGTAPEITFPDGNSSDQSFTLRIWDDVDVETAETIILTYSISGTTDAVPGSFNQTMTITIEDDDFTPDVAGRNVLLDEDFETGSAGWSLINFGGAAPVIWQLGNAGLPGTSAYISNNGGTTRGDDPTRISRQALVTPSIDATAVAQNMILEFDLDVDGNANDYFELFYNDGGGWIVWQSAINNFSGTYRTTLPALLQGINFDLAFIWRNDGDGSISGDVPSIDNVLVYVEGQPAVVETALSSEEVPFGPNSTVYVYSGSENDIVARVVNNSAWDYGCTTFAIDRTGTGATQFQNGGPANFLADKTLLVTPTNNNPTGSYNIRLYYSDAEIAGWEAATGQSRNDLAILKCENAISTATGNTEIGTSTVRGTYNSSDFYVEADFSTGFSGFGVFAETANPLPIKLVSFSGELQDKAISLNWQTATEINNDYFILERSADGINFEAIAEIDGAGNSTSARFYQYLDVEPFIGENYYRLKQVDFDGTMAIVNQIVIIQFEEGAFVEITPNPIRNGFFQLGYSSNLADQNLTAQIYSVDGRLQLEQQLEVKNGVNQFQFDVSSLGDGVYILRTLREDGIEHNLRFVILR